MKPIISYYGGKQRMASKIVPLIPQHTVYVEPFCGGATVLFAKPWPKITNNDHYREVINDSDERLVNFYQQLRDNGPALIELLQLTPFSKTEYQRVLGKNLNSDDRLEAARRYFLNISQSFANKLNGGWQRRVWTQNGPVIWLGKIARLPEYLARMASVSIECDDALTIIKHWDSPQTFFYCDPPYPGTSCGHYGGYTLEDYSKLIAALDAAQGSFMLSNYHQEGIEIPPDWERFEFDAIASSSGKGKVRADRTTRAAAEELGNRKRTEIVYRRFNKAPVRSEIQKLYDSGAFDCFVKAPK